MAAIGCGVDDADDVYDIYDLCIDNDLDRHLSEVCRV